MAVPKYKFTLVKGEDSQKIFQWKDSRKIPVDMTGYSIECKLFSANATIFKTLTSGSEITMDPTSGKFVINFSRTITEQKLTAFSKYEIWLTLPNGNLRCFLSGQLSFIDP